MKVHHNTAKKAKAHGITLTAEDGEIVASKGKTRLASGLSGNIVLNEAIERLAGPHPAAKAKRAAKPRDEDEDEVDGEGVDDAEGDEPSEDEEPAGGRSIIKAKYKAIYKPYKMTNGDDLNALLRDYLYVVTDAGEERIDPARLKKFAKANECWVESYSSLKNIGMVRMNVCNRLRAKLRRDPDFKVEWPK